MTEPSKASEQPYGHNIDEVCQQAIDDLGQAASLLPEAWTGDNKGRATKGAALAYRAKVYMQAHASEEAQKDLSWLLEGTGKQYYALVAY